jgi:prepilin-type N-terminal cleavage/methylation domain-containing protein
MKKAFTLIELLVVIAIIAILAAILFPVFAQAKVAAKKAVSISNQKQIGLSIIMYAGDADDVYPRQDGCTLNDSILDQFNKQPAGTNPTPWCNGSANPGAFAFRDNHYSWQKWVVPYLKNKQIFFHPVIAPIYGTGTTNGAWNGVNQGELESGYALNLAITGALNTWKADGSTNTGLGAIRNSFLGGSQTNVPSPAEAMLMMEQPFHAEIGAWEDAAATTVNYFPMALKEHWKAIYYKLDPASTQPCHATDVVDPKAVPFGTIPVSFTDGHTKAMNPGELIGKSPSIAEYAIPGASAGSFCSPAAAWFGAAGAPVWQTAWPFWGLS